MANVTIPAGKYAVVTAIGTDGSGNPAPLRAGTMVMTINAADSAKVYVAGIPPNQFAFVSKALPAPGATVTFGFTYAGSDGSSGAPLPVLPLTGEIDGPPPPPQIAIHLAFAGTPAIVDLVATPPPPDPGTDSAKL